LVNTLSDNETQKIDARASARLLLDTMPLMRGIFGAWRHLAKSEDEVISMGQFRMLEILRHAPRTLSELANLHHVTPSTMSRTVDVLVRRDLVDRRPAPNDRRQVTLTLTDEGLNALAASRQQTFELTARLLEQLSDDEQTRLYDGLQVLHDLAKRINDEHGPCFWRQPSETPEASDAEPEKP
jgi:DNA-binding MarR family transcriptional regulator